MGLACALDITYWQATESRTIQRRAIAAGATRDTKTDSGLKLLLSKPLACERSVLLRWIACSFLITLTACGSLGSAGPSSASIKRADGVMVENAPIRVVEVTDSLAREVAKAHEIPTLSNIVGDAPATETIIGPGDQLQVTILEAPPAVLFGGTTTFGSGGGSGAPSATINQSSEIPEMMVDERGQIRIPFAGSILAAGRSPQQVEREIARRLAGMAHDPQVSVRITRNSSATVAVVGEVGASGRVPISPRGERLLDAIAGAGGVTKPVDKVSVQVTRGGRVAYLPLETVIRDPAQNIRLGRDDIVNVMYQPFSFTALGATNTSGEIPFESTGLTLAQALGRVGGAKDDRASAQGVFVFRFENPDAVDPATAAASPRTADGRIPVIYRVDLRNPATLFAAQHFPISDKDILYVSTAPVSDLQRFMNIVSSMIFNVIGIGNAIPGVNN